jgi:hypothetical protein
MWRRGCDLTRDEYLSQRRRYEPKPVRLVIVAESPPASGKYFYNPEGLSSEPLFAALMLQLSFSPRTKQDGLSEFQRRGWALIDATYEPVNKHTDSRHNMAISKRNMAMTRDYPLLRNDLASLMSDRSAPLTLIKANVCETLEPKLVEDGFNALNCGRSIPFPSHGHQPKFHQLFSELIKAAKGYSAG